MPIPLTPAFSAPVHFGPVPVSLDSTTHQAPFVAPLSSEPVRRQNGVIRAWKKIGGGSLVLSLFIHVGILVAAYFIVQTIVIEDTVDFLPDEGSKASQAASENLKATTKVKTLSRLNTPPPSTRIVINGPTTMKIPDTPLDSLALEDTASLLSSGAMSPGNFSAKSLSLSPGSGPGMGQSKNFLGRTMFGRVGGDEGVPGVLYDFKQDRDRKVLEYTPQMYFPALAKAASKKYSESVMRDYYRAKQEMAFTYLCIPYMRATEGPKAFKVENEVEPRGWFVHYSGTIVPPEPGEWRFVGNFDDVLIVYINNKVVLDGSWSFASAVGEKFPDTEVRQGFGGPPILTNNQRCWAGKWVRLNGPAKIDIVVGEVPGGSVGGILLCQHKKTKYRMREDGTPILPVFTTTRPDMQDMAQFRSFITKPPIFEIEMENVPVFEVKKASGLEQEKRTTMVPPSS